MPVDLDAALARLAASAGAADDEFEAAYEGWAAWLAQQPTRRDGHVYWITVHAAAGSAFGAALLAGDPDALTLRLTRLASSPLPDARCIACWALAEVGRVQPDIVDGLGRRLAADDAWTVRESIANAFDDVFGPAQPERLFSLMTVWARDENANIRRVPTNALMRYGRANPPPVIELMGTLRHDPSAYVRDNVAFCLGVMGLVRHPTLGHPDPANPQRLLGYLTAWAADPDPLSRWIVAETLGRAWAKAVPTAARDLLGRLAADPDKKVARRAAASLKKLPEGE